MSELERWQTRFSAPDYAFGKVPNAFLKAQAHRLRPGQTALSVADGEGRNGVWLAEQGLDVLTIDFSLAGLAKALALAAERGVKLRTYKNAPPSIRELWLSTAAYGDRDYMVYLDERITYAEAHAQAAAIANWLQREGVKPGDRVAIAMRNFPEWMLIYWACVSTGLEQAD